MKGKEAAAAARRRVEVLEQELAAAKTSATEERKRYSDALRDERAEVARLSGALDRDVRRIAEERVAEAVGRVTEQWHAEREAKQERVREACAFLAVDGEFRVSMDTLARFCLLLEVTPEDVLQKASNRRGRRATASHINAVVTETEFKAARGEGRKTPKAFQVLQGQNPGIRTLPVDPGGAE